MVSAIALIAVAVAVAAYAPQLSAALVHAGLSTALAGAVTAAASIAVSVVASAVVGAVAASPADAPSGIRKPVMVRDASGFKWVETPPAAPVPETLQPIEPKRFWHAHFFPGQRWSIDRLSGDCMDGSEMEGARWVLIDRYAPIEPGKPFLVNLDDLWTSYAPVMRFSWLHRFTAVGMVKRYLGTEPEWGRIIFECTNPPVVCETGRNHVRAAYAVVGHSRSVAGILRLWWLARFQ